MNTGSALARFTITLSQAVTEPVQVEWFTSDGTAKAGVDYAENEGTAVFAPGETAKTVDILVYGRAVGSEDRSFFVEMLPPTNAILGSSIGECIITVDTSGSTPVTAIIVPTGPQGVQGKSAYQSYLDTTTDNPPMTEAEWVESLKGDPAEIAQEVAPLIDVGATVLTAEGTEGLESPDSTTVKAIARRVAYATAARISKVILADGTNYLTNADLTGDEIDFYSSGFIPRVLRGGVFIEPQWFIDFGGELVIQGAVAGDILYAIEYNFNSSYQRLARESSSEHSYFRKFISFGLGNTLYSVNDVLLWSKSEGGDGNYYQWNGDWTSQKIVPPSSTPASTGGVGANAWVNVGQATFAEVAASPDGTKKIGHGSQTLYEALGPFAATGATNKFSKEDRANRFLFSDDYGDPAADTGNSINLALDYLATQGDVFSRGGTVNIPRGFRLVNHSVLLDRTAPGSPDVGDSISIIGGGVGTSELRAGPGLSSVSAIIKSNEPGGNAIQVFRLSDFSTRGGYNGIRVETASRTTIERMRIESATNSGVFIGNSWVNSIDELLVSNAGVHGVEFDATRQKTSTLVKSSYVNKTTIGSGWVWGFMNYSAAICAAADACKLYGHHIVKSEAFSLIASGNEGAGRAGIFAEASAAIGENKSITVLNHFSHNSNLDNQGYANLLHLKSSDNAKNVIRVMDSTSHNPNFGVQDVIADGVGAIAIVDNCVMPNGVKAVNGGYIDWIHHPLLVNKINYGAGAARVICGLRSTQGYTNTWGGRMTIHASNAAPSQLGRRTATYELLVNKTLDGSVQVVEVAKAGETTGANNSSPSFTWSINGIGQLVAATATATISGDFWFEISTSGQVVAQAI